MTQPAKSQEPSMEEILASIRRIISDDESAKAPPPRAADPVAQQTVSPTGELPRVPAAENRPAIAPSRSAGPGPNSRFNEADSAYGTGVVAANSPPSPNPVSSPSLGGPNPRSSLYDLAETMTGAGQQAADVSRAASRDAFSHGERSEPAPITRPQTQGIFDPKLESRTEPKPEQRFDQRLVSPATGAAVDQSFNSLAQTVLVQNARTIEDLVKEMLRPMLKSWLDENLPGLVERLVRAEIERVSRGRS
jgi:cell pole-organizing protein PopZ